MSYIIEGIWLGLFLAISLGPIFVTLTQASLEKGASAGFAVGFGVWVSDIIILAISLIMINEISETISSTSFQFWLGISGASILLIYGIMLLITKVEPTEPQAMLSLKSFGSFWMKGFLINTVNPFTFVFWLGVLSTYVIGRQTPRSDVITLLITIMVIIILSDSLKVLLARSIRHKLKPEHFHWISKGAGIGLIIFGGILLYKVI